MAPPRVWGRSTPGVPIGGASSSPRNAPLPSQGSPAKPRGAPPTASAAAPNAASVSGASPRAGLTHGFTTLPPLPAGLPLRLSATCLLLLAATLLLTVVLVPRAVPLIALLLAVALLLLPLPLAPMAMIDHLMMPAHPLPPITSASAASGSSLRVLVLHAISATSLVMVRWA